MKAVLFRKIVVDDVNYYQLYSINSNFNPDDKFTTFDSRESKDYSYIEFADYKKIPKPKILNIYTGNGDNFELVNDEALIKKVKDEIQKKYYPQYDEILPVREVVNRVKEKILFQDSCITELVNQIYLNQAIVNSDMPIELKVNQKSNILFYGKEGSGKKTIVECIENELKIPYADIKISSGMQEVVETIITKLFEKSRNEEEASHGIVFIRDNYEELMDTIGEKIYDYLNFITSQGTINYYGKPIDFRTLTFVIMVDEKPYAPLSDLDIENLQNLTNCDCCITTRELTNNEKFMILFSKNGRLRHYERFLNKYGKKLYVDEDALNAIIDTCSKLDNSMTMINSLIDAVIKESMSCGKIDDVYIDEECLFAIANKFDYEAEHKHEKVKEEKKKVQEDKYSFEKRIDEIVARVKEDVIGQDVNVKRLVYAMVNNLIWANREDVDDPKKYIKNILIRGNTGTGKTFIPSKILKYLGVPYYIANATEYTESGYIGHDVEEMLVNLYHAAGNNLKLAERGVLVIDEVDKRPSRAGEGSHNIGGGFQEALYKLAEGTKIRINVGTKLMEEWIEFDTSRLTIILSGAFENIEDYRDKRCGKRKPGFGSQEGNGQDPNIIDEDYMTYGMERQFMRRVKHIIELPDVTKEQLIDIMKKSASSALKIEKETLKNIGIDVEYKEDFYDAIAKKAIEMKQGVTGVEKSLLKTLHNINIQDIRASEVSKIIFTGDVVSDPSKIVLVTRGNRKTKKI